MEGDCAAGDAGPRRSRRRDCADRRSRAPDRLHRSGALPLVVVGAAILPTNRSPTGADDGALPHVITWPLPSSVFGKNRLEETPSVATTVRVTRQEQPRMARDWTAPTPSTFAGRSSSEACRISFTQAFRSDSIFFVIAPRWRISIAVYAFPESRLQLAEDLGSHDPCWAPPSQLVPDRPPLVFVEIVSRDVPRSSSCRSWTSITSGVCRTSGSWIPAREAQRRRRGQPTCGRQPRPVFRGG